MLEKLTAGKLKGRLILGRRTGLAIFKNVTLFQILNFPLEKLHFYFTRLKKSRPFLWDFWNFFWRSCTFTELETFLRVILGDSLIPISDKRCTNQCTNWPAPVVIGVGARCFQDLELKIAPHSGNFCWKCFSWTKNDGSVATISRYLWNTFPGSASHRSSESGSVLVVTQL